MGWKVCREVVRLLRLAEKKVGVGAEIGMQRRRTALGRADNEEIGLTHKVSLLYWFLRECCPTLRLVAD